MCVRCVIYCYWQVAWLFCGSLLWILDAWAEESFPVSMRVDAAATGNPLKPNWRFFGCDEQNYATRKYGEKLLGELGDPAPNQVLFRTHNLSYAAATVRRR